MPEKILRIVSIFKPTSKRFQSSLEMKRSSYFRPLKASSSLTAVGILSFRLESELK